MERTHVSRPCVCYVRDPIGVCWVAAWSFRLGNDVDVGGCTGEGASELYESASRATPILYIIAIIVFLAQVRASLQVMSTDCQYHIRSWTSSTRSTVPPRQMKNRNSIILFSNALSIQPLNLKNSICLYDELIIAISNIFQFNLSRRHNWKVRRRCDDVFSIVSGSFVSILHQATVEWALVLVWWVVGWRIGISVWRLCEHVLSCCWAEGWCINYYLVCWAARVLVQLSSDRPACTCWSWCSCSHWDETLMCRCKFPIRVTNINKFHIDYFWWIKRCIRKKVSESIAWWSRWFIVLFRYAWYTIILFKHRLVGVHCYLVPLSTDIDKC